VDYDFPVKTGSWYLVSLPVVPDSLYVQKLFPDALKPVYGWNFNTQSYVTVDKLEPGKAYWILFLRNYKYKVCGKVIESYSNNYFKPGWDLIGSAFETVPVKGSPEGTIAGMIGFDPITQKYVHAIPASARPTQGYWLAVAQKYSSIEAKAEDYWTVPVDLMTYDNPDGTLKLADSVIFGTKAGTTDRRDAGSDLLNAPSLFGVDMFFKISDSFGSLSTDYRSDAAKLHQWTLVIVQIFGKKVKLSWDVSRFKRKVVITGEALGLFKMELRQGYRILADMLKQDSVELIIDPREPLTIYFEDQRQIVPFVQGSANTAAK